MNHKTYIEQMDAWTEAKIPYLFIIDFDKTKPFLVKLSDLNIDNPSVLFEFPTLKNTKVNTPDSNRCFEHLLKEHFVSFLDYQQKFDKAVSLMKKKNVEVINLTQPTRVELQTDLEHVFDVAKAKYKVMLRDEFVCFSPEIFIRVSSSGIISTYPMKGTIDANIPGAEDYILNSPKEISEHSATVELLKKDLAQVADDITVPRFRYIDRLTTSNKDLLQVSSEVVGLLKAPYKNAFGSLVDALLPAGSILGSPKVEAKSIIDEVEGYSRGYYTGVCGIFDGEYLDSCVLIRIIEKDGDDYFYKSGGGITTESIAQNEYDEIKNKIYVSVD